VLERDDKIQSSGDLSGRETVRGVIIALEDDQKIRRALAITPRAWISIVTKSVTSHGAVA
jgi:hypothetical protein